MYVSSLEGNPRFPQFVPSMGWNLGEGSFHGAQLRVLIIFPSSLEVRVISSTHAVLYNIIKARFGDDVFVDFWMEPPRYNRVHLRKHYPWVVGYLSKHTWEDFDVLAFSLSVAVCEFVEMAEILRDARIPAWSGDRLGDPKMPLLVAGGIAAGGTSMLDNVVDLFMLGMGERTFPLLVEECFRGQARLGSVARAKEAIIGACQSIKGFYNPKLYRYSERVVGGSLECVYEGCDVPELREVEPDVSLPAEALGVSDRQLGLPVPGRAHKASVQVSLGCGGARGTCNFDFSGSTLISTSEGLICLEELYERLEAGELGGVQALNPKTGGHEDITGVYRVREADIWRFTLNDGSFVDVTPDHDLVDVDWNIRLARDFRVGDSLNVVFNSPSLFGGPDVSFLQGDGWMSGGFLAGLFLRFGAFDYREEPYFSFKLLSGESRLMSRLIRAGAIAPLGYDASSGFYCIQDEGYRELVLSLFPSRANAGAAGEVNLQALSRLGVGDFMAFACALMLFSGEIEVRDGDMPLGLVRVSGFSRGVLGGLHVAFHYYGVPCVLADGEAEGGCVLLFSVASLKALPEWVFGWDLCGRLKEARDAALEGEGLYGHDAFWESRIRRVELLGRFVTFNLAVEPSHLVQCNGFISSSQCHEGSLYGAWRERSPDDIARALEVAKRSSMAESVSFMSFNGNYLSDFGGSLRDAASYFHRLTSLQFRMDALAASIRDGGRDNYLALLKELKTVSVSCLHGSAYVTTRRGLVPIGQLVAGDYVWSPAFAGDGDGRSFGGFGWREVKAVIPQGQKPLYRLVTKNGASVIATADHRFVSLERGEQNEDIFRDVEARDLAGRRVMLTGVPGDFEDSHNVLSFGGTGFDVLTEDLAFLLGWFCACGHIGEGDEVSLNAAKSGHLVFDDLARALRAYGLRFDVERRRAKSGDERRVIIRSHAFYGFLSLAGAVRSDGVSKKFPRVVYGQPTRIMLCFLRGFFASRVRFVREEDRRDGRAYLSCKCLHPLPRSMAYNVQRVVNGLGFVSRLVRSSEVEGQLYRMTVVGDAWDFYSRVGFGRYYEFGDAPGGGDAGFHYDVVESVEYWGDDECYDITVEGSPYFVASGIVSHNCPIEGVSERCRDFLNKNLSEDDIVTVSDEVFRLRFIKLKHSAIFTGYETRGDFEEHGELCRRLVSLRDERGANTGITFNSSMLVHMHGTPLYYVPRKSAAMAWKQFFARLDGGTFYFNPFAYLQDLGVKVKLAGRPYDTVLQQVQQDMSCSFLEEAILKPVLGGKLENGSDGVLASVRDVMREWGIAPKAQFLEADFAKLPRQHLRVGFFDRNYAMFSGGDGRAYALGSRDHGFAGHGFCLRTAATDYKGSLKPCVGCRSCGDIDRERLKAGLPPEAGGSHSCWMHGRELGSSVGVLDIKSAILASSPSFYYCFVFDMDRRAVGISKEVLVRRWLSFAAEACGSLVANFRHIKSALFRGLEFPHWTSLYYGLEVAVMGFRDALDLEKMEGVVALANRGMESSGVRCVRFGPQQSSGFSVDLILSSVRLVNVTEAEVARFVGAVDEPHRAYYTQRQPRLFGRAFWYKLVSSGGGATMVYLMPPKFSVVWSEGTKVWQQTMVQDKMSDWRVHAAYARGDGGVLVDVVTGKAFCPSGFIAAGSGSGEREEEEAGVELVSS